MLHYFQEKKLHTVFEEYIEKETLYHFSDILGMGSYGVAYLLIHKQTKQKVVMKRLRAKHRKNTKTRSKFSQEISMLKLLDEPSIPALLHEGELSNIPFFIMEHVDGSTFQQLFFEESVQFTEMECLQIAKQLFEIVLSLHSKGIVHRDLRIPNILIQNGQLKLIDFGLSAYIKKNSIIQTIKNPKKAENHISDLYYIGHFLLFLLYSNYEPSTKKERSWQEELQISVELKRFIERLLLIGPGFSSAKEAYEDLVKMIKSEQQNP